MIFEIRGNEFLAICFLPHVGLRESEPADLAKQSVAFAFFHRREARDGRAELRPATRPTPCLQRVRKAAFRFVSGRAT